MIKWEEIQINSLLMMFNVASVLIEKNVELDTFDSDDFIFNFKDDLDSNYKWLQFLRCAAIFDHFARGYKITKNENENSISKNEFIDWDVFLSPSNLCRHYNVHKTFNSNNNNDYDSNNEGDEMTLPMFSFINYLNFIQPPFSAPILESNDCEVHLCLLTGKTVLKKPSSSPGNTEKYIILSRFLDDDFNGSFSVFLKLNGDDASQVIIDDIEFNKIYVLRPFILE